MAKDEEDDKSGSVEDLLNRDWTGEVLTRVDSLVDSVHDRAVIPVVTVIRAFVFGVIIAVMTLACLILLAIALVRILNNYAFNNHIWAAYGAVGTLFFLAGSVAWIKRKPKSA